MQQRLEPLNPEDQADIEAKRKWVRDHFDEGARQKYETLEDKLRLLDTIIRNKWIAPTETLKLQCLGISFGDALAQKLHMSWVTAEDEYGRDPALRFEYTSVVAFPLTAISKRIEHGEDVDVYVLFEQFCEAIERMKAREVQ
jgi:hypothetical protein